MEECGIEVELEGIVGVYSDPKRDPRGHTVGIVFKARCVSGEPKFGDDAADVKLFTREELKGIAFAFDHQKILKDAGWLT